VDQSDCHLGVHEIFFHHCPVMSYKTNKLLSKEEKGEGYLLHKATNKNQNEDLFFEQNSLSTLCDKAFLEWIKELNVQAPEKHLRMGEPVNFPEEAKVHDNRHQLLLNPGGNIPALIQMDSLVTYMGWHVMRIVNCLGLAPEFTRHIPIDVQEGKKIHPGQKKITWPIVEPTKPVHLWIDGVVILFGGMSLNSKGLLQSDPSKVVHQAAHTDFSNPLGPCNNQTFAERFVQTFYCEYSHL
jgi:hypothetical protein